MKLNKYKKLLKEEFEDTINPIEIKEESKKYKFRFQFKIRYVFLTAFAVLIIFLIANHISVTNYNNKIDEKINNFDILDLNLSTAKYESKESLQKAIDDSSYVVEEKKHSVLQTATSLFRGCSASKPVYYDEGTSSQKPDKNSYDTNVVEKGIDEADIAKCDGTYIYRAFFKNLIIYDLDGNEIFNGTLPSYIINMYVYGNKIVIFHSYQVSIYKFEANELILEQRVIGYFPDSRLYENNLYLVSKKSLNFDIVDYTNCYYDKSSNPNALFDIFKVNLDTLEMKEGNIVSNKDSTLYMSENYIYLATRTTVYYNTYTIFFIMDLDLNGYATFSRKGYIPTKYAFSEYNGFFRFVLTSSPYNSLYCYNLKEKKFAGDLENKLGEYRETIRSVRFNKNKCYVCTYIQTDPLYVIDLSNPEEPTILSELHVPGYSNYLHYFEINGETYVLGIGFDDTNRSKITIYKDENDDLIQIGKSLVLNYYEFEKEIASDTYVYNVTDKNDELEYLSDFINLNVIGYFFYTDSNYLYFGAPVSAFNYTMFKIDVTNNDEPIEIYYEYKTDVASCYTAGCNYLRCFLVNSKLYYLGANELIIVEF